MRRSTLLNKSKGILLTTEIVDKIINNEIKSVIIPVTNRNLYSNKDILYCKEQSIDENGKIIVTTKDTCRCFIKINKYTLCKTDYITNEIAISMGFENIDSLIKNYNEYIKYYLEMTCRNECQKVTLFKNIYQFNKNPDIQIISFEKLESSNC